MAMKICIDAGHYGKYNRSPVVAEYYESDMTWKLHLLLKKHLEQHGFEVITTRPNKDGDLSLYNRGAKSTGCDLFLSLHSNAAYSSGDPVEKQLASEKVDRVDVYAPISGKGHDIAKKLADCIASVMQTNQLGYVKTRKSGSGGEYYGVIRGAVAVGTIGLLVEHSFHTNTRAAKWLLDDGNLDKMAKAEAQVIAEHFGMTGKVEAAQPSAPEAEKASALGDRLLQVDDPMMRGEDVREMQKRLNALGYGCGNPDGVFGQNTEKGVRTFQKAAGIAVDGIFGPKSLAALKAAEAAKNACTEYAVKHGDTLWEIAKKYLGDGRRYPEIVKLNGLKSNVLHTGDKLKLPKK